MFTKLPIFLSLLLISLNVQASKPIDPSSLSSTFHNTVQKVMPNIKPSIFKTEIEGLYKVVHGARFFYISKSGQFVVNGYVIDVVNNRNVTKDQHDNLRKVLLSKEFSDSEMVVYTPADGYKHTITVFSDIECSACKKMHSELNNYLNNGIRVRYLMFPREGMSSTSAQKSMQVFCSKDKKLAYSNLIEGRTIDYDSKCLNKSLMSKMNPVNRSYIIGQTIGITGTPAIVSESGGVIPGYVPADKLVYALDQEKEQMNSLSSNSAE